ncbi:glycosyltransferase family 2 protein [bacterium]|nr:glycosyltransferase family 2 protein [bacterium]
MLHRGEEEQADSAKAQQPSRPALRQAVCCIIPAYEEAGRVAKVVELALVSGLFDEVVVVDDASRDRTGREAEQAGARVLRHSENQGKAAALRTGMQATSAPVLCLLDADLVNVNAGHLHALIEPVLSGRQRSVIAVFRGGGLKPTTLAQQIAPMISGQRCLLRELLDDFEDWDSGYGVETALNAHLKTKGVEQVMVEWYGASHIMKEQKRGLLLGAAMRTKMFFEITVAWFKARIGGFLSI